MSELNSVNGLTGSQGNGERNPVNGQIAGEQNKEAKTGTPSGGREEELSSERAGAPSGDTSKGVNAFNVVPGDRKLPELPEDLIQGLRSVKGGQQGVGEATREPLEVPQTPSRPLELRRQSQSL